MTKTFATYSILRDCLKLDFQSRLGLNMGRKQNDMLGFVPDGTKYLTPYFTFYPYLMPTACS